MSLLKKIAIKKKSLSKKIKKMFLYLVLEKNPYEKELKLIRKFKLNLSLNKYKFERGLLDKLEMNIKKLEMYIKKLAEKPYTYQEELNLNKNKFKRRLLHELEMNIKKLKMYIKNLEYKLYIYEEEEEEKEEEEEEELKLNKYKFKQQLLQELEMCIKNLEDKQPYEEELKLIRKFKLNLSLNKYKFERRLLHKLGMYIKKFYKKKVEFNVVNLKSINFNIEIYTNILTLRIRRRKRNVSPRAGRASLNLISRVKFPRVNNIKERTYQGKIKDMSFIENNYKNLNINSIISKDAAECLSTLPPTCNSQSEHGIKKFTVDVNTAAIPAAIAALQQPDTTNLATHEGDSLNKLLKKAYLGLDFNNKEDYSKIEDIIFNKIKYKNMGGIKSEISGRLTRRYRADRALFDRKRRGGLNNIDASFKRLSSVILRGCIKSNVEYTLFTSKRRIGSFAVKG